MKPLFLFGLLGLFSATMAKGATFTCFPSVIYLYPGETKHLKITSDVAGALSATVNPASPGPYTMPSGAVTGTTSVEIECTAADSVSSTFTASKSAACSVTPPGQSPQTGNVFFTIAVLPIPSINAANPDSPTAGDPVSTRTGEYYALEGIDINLGGPMPLFFARYYGSRIALDTRTQSSFGANRLHHFESRLVYPGSRHADIITNRGRVISFVKTGKTWTLTRSLDIPYRLVETATTFILGDPHSRLMWTYDSVSGRLLKIEDGRGNVHTLTYDTVTPFRLLSVSDGLGRTLAFTYTTGKLTTVTDHTGRTVNFVHTGPVLTSASTPLGYTTTYAHTSTLLTSFTRPEANTPFTQVHTTNRVTSQTERATDTSTLSYLGLNTTFTDPTAATIVDSYNIDGELTTHTDQAGKAMTMTYDATGRRTSVTDRLGHTTKVSYHALSGLPEVITTAEGRTSKRTYKSRALNGLTFYDLATVVHPDGASRAFTYDAKGNLTGFTDEAGKKWKFTHNALGQVLTVTNPLGGISIFTYDAKGNLASSKDPDTDPTTCAYDNLNRLTTITRPGGATVVIAYDADDRITSITDERGKTHTFTHDDNARLTGIIDPDAKTTTLAYDTLDRVNQITDRLGKISGVTHNSRRLLDTVTDRNGNSGSLQYDSRQRPISFTDPAAKVWPCTFDDEGLLATFATPIDPPTTIKRNRLGRHVELSDPLGHTSRWTRDARQRVIQQFDPLGRLTSFVYDKRGFLASTVEQGTGAAKFDRDGLGRVAKMTDPNGGVWAFTYTKGGRLLAMTDPLGKKTTHTYDTRGRRNITTFADATTETRTYDNAGNLTRRLFTDGTDLTFTYDNLNRLTATNGVEFTRDAEGRITNCRQNSADFTATYDDGGRLATVSYLNGAVVVTYIHDTRDRLTKVSDSVSSAQIDFTYDDAGRLLTATRSNGVHGARTYDAAGRLTRIVEGAIIDLDYTLNAAGEVTVVDFEAPSLPAVTAAPAQLFKVNKSSQVATDGYTYDLRGRQTAAPGKTWQWDGATRLTNANGVTVAYTGLGDVISRTVSAATTTFAHHHAIRLAPIVAETPPAGATRCYVWTPDGRLLYSINLGTSDPTFYHFDHVGSTLALTDESGAVTDSYAYGSYGELLSPVASSSQPFTYVGQWGVRAEGALYHMRARYYDPATARFLSRDPAPIGLHQTKRLNLYEYAAQNPLAFIDPEGTEPEAAGKAGTAERLPPGSYRTPEQRNHLEGSAAAIVLMMHLGVYRPSERLRAAEEAMAAGDRMIAMDAARLQAAAAAQRKSLEDSPPLPGAQPKPQEQNPISPNLPVLFPQSPAAPGDLVKPTESDSGSASKFLAIPPAINPFPPVPQEAPPDNSILGPLRRSLQRYLESIRSDSILDQIDEVLVIS